MNYMLQLPQMHINSMAQQIAALNEEIAGVIAVKQQPNDLLDQRDRLLDQLASVTGATSSVQDNGEVIVSIGGHALVVGGNTFELETTTDPTTHMATISWEDGRAFNVSSGELAGLIQVRDTEIPNMMTSLDNFASTLITEVNAVHQSGYGLNNDHLLDFFSGTDALSIGVSSDVSDIDSIATAAAIDTPGDGSIASQIAALQHELLIGGTSQTLNQYYSDFTATLGFDITNAGNSLESRQLVLDSLTQQRESLTGVNLDEEAANLVKAQRAYQATARLVNVMDEMLDRVINGMGLVGR